MFSLRRVGTHLLALFLLLVPVAVTAREPTAAGMAKPALWKVSDRDITIWLFGTIHILPPGVDWYGGPIARALETSDTLVTEVAEAQDPANALVMARLALSDPPANLRQGLSPEGRRAYEETLAKLKLPPAAFDANDPWFAAVMISMLPLLQDGFGTMNGAEAQLAARAKEKGLRQIGLETAEYQLGLFDALSPDVQRKYLGEIVRSFPDIPKEVREMVEAWKGGRAEDLARMMNEDESDPALMKTLLTDRNRTWAKWIEARMKQPGTVFVAVGAGHMAGRDSVLSLLRQDHVKITRVQ